MKSIMSIIITTLLIVLIQVFVLERIDLTLGEFNFVHLYVYPYLILMLPMDFDKYFAILFAFIVGIAIDIFLGTYGIHASALSFMAFARNQYLRIIEPREGYESGSSPTILRQGYGWMMLYTSLLLFLHMTFLFSVEAFSFIYISEILLRTIFSFVVSFILIFLLIIIFNAR